MSQTETCQSGILASVPKHGRYLWFQLKDDHAIEGAKTLIDALLCKVDGQKTIIGFGDVALKIMDKTIEGSVEFPSFNGRY